MAVSVQAGSLVPGLRSVPGQRKLIAQAVEELIWCVSGKAIRAAIVPRRKDIWRCAFVAQPIEEIVSRGIDDAAVSWFSEEPSFCFLADPFGVWEGDVLHVFAESYDYRTRHGVIERLSFDRNNTLIDRRESLREAWHLSYPFVFEGEGATWMLPEAHRSGRLTLYRAHGYFDDWRPEYRIDLDCVPVDASILRWEGRWWLFYASAASKMSKLAHLHVAWAEKLCGPWISHPANPVRIEQSSSRPGGKPIVIGGKIMLPVQDCVATYGGAIRPLWIGSLDESEISAEAGEALAIPSSASPYSEGMHTLTACGPVTLIDCKRIDRSLTGLALDFRRAFAGYAAR